jgi:hypothetical protein
VRRAIVISILIVGCGGSRPAAKGIPEGTGWTCGARGDGTNFCVRREEYCTEAAAKSCTKHDVAHCFSYSGAHGATLFSCKPSAPECEEQAARFAKDEKDVSRCEERR